jgi:hypothetical protein
MLLDDFLFLIEKKRFNFVYSIIVPLLTIDDGTRYVPICLHSAYEIENVAIDFAHKIRKIEERGANANKLLADGKISTDYFDELEREKFQTTFKQLFLNNNLIL